MKSILLPFTGLALALCSSASGQVARLDETAKVTTQGVHHRIWERLVAETTPDGKQILRPRQYLELETGMNYWEGGQWKEAKAEIEMVAGHAVASRGNHKVIFAPNITDPEVIFLETPDGKQLRSRILGLSYFDTESGKAVLIAAPKSTDGQVLPPNRVVYSDAFDDIRADVEYIYTKAGFEQNIILRAQLPLPAEFGLNPRTTALQVLTEFFNPPALGRAQSVRVAGLPDEYLDFGVMKMGRGRGFSVGDGADTREVPITKQWATQEGRDFLVEEVPVPVVEDQIDALISNPRGAAIRLERQGQGQNVIAALKNVLPRRMAKKSTGKSRMAKLDSLDQTRARGFVLDYTITMASATNFTFKSDTTHYVSGPVYLSGTTTFEGGTILKYAVSSSASVVASNTVWQTDSYRPAVFTSKNDNSMGETISGSTGNPATNFAGGIALDLAAQTSPLLAQVKFSYLSNAVNGSHVTMRNAQLIQCYSVFASSADTFTLQNVLGFKLGTLQKQTCGVCTPAAISAENVTLHYVTNLVSAITNASIALTNCLFARVTNLQPATIITNHSYVLGDDNGLFQAVNGGSHYLATNSAYRDN